MFDLTAVFWLTLIVMFVYYWRRALIAKEQAFVAAQRHCEAMQVQLLDQNVYLRRLWFKRDGRGRLCLWRAFYFEFTVIGDDRYVGRVIMLGNRVSEVQLDPHRMH
jgi:hypothetical protein